LFAAARPVAGRRNVPIAIALETSGPTASLVGPDEELHDVLKYEVWAVDLGKKKAVKSVAREARLVARQVAATASASVAYQVQTVLELPPGRYQLRAS